jgi:hypothetical protein
MNTQAIRFHVTGTTSIQCLARAVLEIADALDELDERMRGEGTPEPGPDTCDHLGPDTDTAPAPSTIPGCYCGKCRHSRFIDEGKYWPCGFRGSPAYAVVSVPVDFGCVFGERREAE